MCSNPPGSDMNLSPVLDEAARVPEISQEKSGPDPSRNPHSDSETELDIHAVPSHWLDEKHEQYGTAHGHLEDYLMKR